MPKKAADTEYSRIQAIAATDALTDCLDDLRASLVTQARQARIFSIPTQTLDEADPPTGPIDDLQGQAAIEAAVQVLTRTQYGDQQHAKSTVRRPGIIQVGQAWAERVAEVNRSKTDLRAAMKAFGYAGWIQWRNAIPAWRRLNRLQAYREWHWFDAPIARISFTWAGNNVGGEQLRIAALIDRLREQYERQGLAPVDTDIDRLTAFNADEVVVIRRPIAPTPIANIRFADGTRKAVKTALPFITSQPIPEISALQVFDAARRNARRSDLATLDKPLNEHLHAYRYVASHRFCLRRDPVAVRIKRASAGIEVRAQGGPSWLWSDPGRRLFEQVAVAAQQTRGAAQQRARLFAMADAPVLLAANVANAFFDAGAHGVWRVPVTDLVKLAAAHD